MIRALAQLMQRLAELPEPSAGYTRVYRGQAKDYGVMIPSGLRPGAPRWNRLWDMALIPFTDRVSGEFSSDQLLENHAYWFKVIAQHYGPGSPFLDVTKSPEVALWFALHEVHVNRTARVLVQRDLELPIECPTIHFTPHADANGWLYILDVPTWDGSGLPHHGELVELEHGPEFIAQAMRVQRQAGCLVAADTAQSNGDLTSLYACSPIAVAQPFDGAPLLERDAAWLFPPPEDDQWYRRLLRAPLIAQPSDDIGYVYQQSLGIYLVVPDAEPEHATPLIDLQAKHLNALTRVALRAGTSMRKLHEITGSFPEAATCICLEAPLLASSPPVLQLWNQSLLLTGLQATAQPEAAASRALLPEVSLENVLMEFSPLEWAFREALDNVIRSPLQWRALWLVRNGDSFWMTLFATTKPGSELEMNVSRVEYSHTEHAFFLVGSDGSWSPLVETAEAKPFFVSLAVLRDLSLSVKPDPILLMRHDETGILPVREPGVRLVRPMRDEHDLRLHFMRYLHSGARYEGPPSTDEVAPVAYLVLDLSLPFERLGGLDAVYAQVRKAELSSGHIMTLPEPDATGRSSGGVRTLREWFPTSGPDRAALVSDELPQEDRGTNDMPTEKEWVMGLFRELVEQAQNDRATFVFAHPVLFSRHALGIVLAESPADSGIVDELDQMRLFLWDHPERFPRGLAPLDPLIDGLRSRELTFQQARERAVRWKCAGLLSNTYIKVVMEPILVEAGNGGAFPAEAAEVVLDSAWAMPFENLALHVRVAATRGFILVVHATLIQTPDGRLLRRAHEAGAWALDAFPSGQADLLHELGVMELDAYASRWHASADYLEQIAQWLARATNPMPEPAEALARAGQLLRDAVELREPGSGRGATLKALLQARIFQAAASASDPDRDELRALASNALDNLDPDRDADAVRWVNQANAVYGLG